MGAEPGAPPRVGLGTLVLAAVGYAGLTLSITLLFFGMRAVMAIGGSCGSGGPYVWAVQPCPDGAVLATIGGTFGLFLFGGLAMLYGGRIGGVWGAAPLLGWVALFGSLGWNFLDYGLFNPPQEMGVDPGLVVVGIVFWIMAFGPLLLVLPFGRASWQAQRAASAERARSGVTVRIGEPAADDSTGRPALVIDGAAKSERQALTEIATDFALAIRDAQAETPSDPLARAASAVAASAAAGDLASVDPAAVTALPAFTALPAATAFGAAAGVAVAPAAGPEAFAEGTQALLDRLERLADMRDRGLLEPSEYEVAKDAVMRELEARR